MTSGTHYVDYYKNLTKIMLTTSGTRFNAAASLLLHERFAVITLAVLSIFLIGVSLVLLAFPEKVGSDEAEFLGGLSVVASVWILAISLFEYGLNRGVRSHQLHDSAMRITGIARAMERELERVPPDQSRLEDLGSEYEQVVSATFVNHSSFDYKLYRLNRATPANWLDAFVLRLKRPLYVVYVFFLSLLPNIVVLSAVAVSTIYFLFFRN